MKAGLEKLGILGLNSQMSDHELDAVTCAYVGKVFLEGKTVTYGHPTRVSLCLKAKNIKK